MALDFGLLAMDAPTFSRANLLLMPLAMLPLVFGAALTSVPFLGLFGFPLALFGAVCAFVFALRIVDPQISVYIRLGGTIIVFVGIVALLFACISAPGVALLLWYGLQGIEVILLWVPLLLGVAAPTLVTFGIRLRSHGPSKSLLFLWGYWFSYLPLTSIANYLVLLILHRRLPT